jgi:hypothetical protein
VQPPIEANDYERSPKKRGCRTAGRKCPTTQVHAYAFVWACSALTYSIAPRSRNDPKTAGRLLKAGYLKMLT